MAANSGVWKPQSGAGGDRKKLAGPCEVTALKLSAGGGAAFVSIYDGTQDSDVNDSNLKWVLDASTTDNDMQSFFDGLIFKKGVYAICEQGINFNPVVAIAAKSYTN